HLVADDAVSERKRVRAAHLDDAALIHADGKAAGIGAVQGADGVALDDCHRWLRARVRTARYHLRPVGSSFRGSAGGAAVTERAWLPLHPAQGSNGPFSAAVPEVTGGYRMACKKCPPNADSPQNTEDEDRAICNNVSGITGESVPEREACPLPF